MNAIHCVAWIPYENVRDGRVARKHIDLSKIVAIDEIGPDDIFPSFEVTCQLVDSPIVFKTGRPWTNKLSEEYQKLLIAWGMYKESQE